MYKYVCKLSFAKSLSKDKRYLFSHKFASLIALTILTDFKNIDTCSKFHISIGITEFMGTQYARLSRSMLGCGATV